jgi:polyhydroxybutyrate depolymerase
MNTIRARILVFITVLACVLSIFSVTPAAKAAASTCSPARPTAVGLREIRTRSGGETRRYWLYVPSSYSPDRAVPLVFSLHGFASNPSQQRWFSRLDALADKAGFIAVFPAGTGIPLRWNAGDSPFLGASRADDVQFFRELIRDLTSTLCIDPTRIYATGLSNGGGMVNRLACELSDQITAIGGVAGAYSPVDCNVTRPVPVIAFHGTADEIVNYKGVTSMRLPGIVGWAAAWAQRNGCSDSESIPAVGDVSGLRYTDCADDAEVVLYTIQDGGHTWPGGPRVDFLGKTSTDIDASAMMWEFFQRYRR